MVTRECAVLALSLRFSCYTFRPKAVLLLVLWLRLQGSLVEDMDEQREGGGSGHERDHPRGFHEEVVILLRSLAEGVLRGIRPGSWPVTAGGHTS